METGCGGYGRSGSMPVIRADWPAPPKRAVQHAPRWRALAEIRSFRGSDCGLKPLGNARPLSLKLERTFYCLV